MMKNLVCFKLLFLLLLYATNFYFKGSGVVSLRSTGEIQPLPFTSSLWNSNEFVGEVSGEVYVTFLDSSSELDTISQDPNHPFTPPMSVSFILSS